jgi:uncharacterized protein
MRPLIVVCICLFCASIAAGQTTSPPLISVTGTAEIKVAPDEVVLTIRVETRNENLQESKKENDGIASKAIAFLKNNGIKDEDIQTSYVSIEAHYDRDKGPTKPQYYTADRSIEAVIRKVDLLEPTVGGLLGLGVNHIDGITFRHSKVRDLRVQARAMAVKAAKEKADALAAELEVKRGKVYHVQADEGGGGFNISNRWSGPPGGIGGPLDSSIGGDESAFSVGQISITATVSASFLIE